MTNNMYHQKVVNPHFHIKRANYLILSVFNFWLYKILFSTFLGKYLFNIPRFEAIFITPKSCLEKVTCTKGTKDSCFICCAVSWCTCTKAQVDLFCIWLEHLYCKLKLAGGTQSYLVSQVKYQHFRQTKWGLICSKMINQWLNHLGLFSLPFMFFGWECIKN